VDAADERDFAVDDHHLAVHAAKPLTVERVAPPLGAEHLEQHAGLAHRLRALRGDVRGAEAVDDDVHGHTPARRALERAGDAAPARIVLEDVGLEIDAVARGVDRPFQCGEVLHAGLEQLDLVAALHARLQALVPPQRDAMRFAVVRPGIDAGARDPDAGCVRAPPHSPASGSSRSATSGLWSESRAHSSPRSTRADLTRKPRW